MKRLRSAVVAFVVLVGACNVTTDSGEPADEPRFVHEDFAITFVTSCRSRGCGYGNRLHEIVYRDGAPLAATGRGGERRPEVLTEGAMRLLPTPQELIELAAADPEATIDGATGLPETFTRGHLKFSKIALVDPAERHRKALADAREMWKTQGPTNYELRYTCPVGCESRAGIAIWRTGDTAIPLNRDALVAPSSMEEILHLLEQALDSDPIEIDVRYAVSGYFRSATIRSESGTIFEIRNVRIGKSPQ